MYIRSTTKKSIGLSMTLKLEPGPPETVRSANLAGAADGGIERAPVVVLQPAERALSNRRAGEAEEEARRMLRHRVELIACGKALDPLVAAANAARETGEEKGQIEIQRRAQPEVAIVALGTAERVAEEELLQARAMRADEAMAAARAAGHLFRYVGATGPLHYRRSADGYKPRIGRMPSGSILIRCARIADWLRSDVRGVPTGRRRPARCASGRPGRAVRRPRTSGRSPSACAEGSSRPFSFTAPRRAATSSTRPHAAARSASADR